MKTSKICNVTFIFRNFKNNEPMEIKYICDVYNFWPRKYISASLKYCQIYFNCTTFGENIFYFDIYLTNIYFFKEGISLHTQQRVRFREYFE